VRIHPVDQQGAAAFEQVDGEEMGSAGNPVATVVGHGGILPVRCIRRKALRFSALLADHFMVPQLPETRQAT